MMLSILRLFISPPYSNWITLTFSCIFIRHPWYNNSFAMSKYPRMAAKCKAVRPSYKWNKKNYKWIWIRQKWVISNIIILYVDIHASFNQIKYHTTKSTTSCIVCRSSRILLLCIIFYIRMSCKEKLMKMLFLTLLPYGLLKFAFTPSSKHCFTSSKLLL